ncbi:hypothetical protein ATANTOWER_010283 [Ataeniobius toweri]|uniref:Sushi domain-containing protein n=1 Tax=Ataeniobius toweri TaxID=208326 RepID=A0ABU7C3G2_9TELE|nr:hypothetical protein [Ataeniobius toweri]
MWNSYDRSLNQGVDRVSSALVDKVSTVHPFARQQLPSSAPPRLNLQRDGAVRREDSLADELYHLEKLTIRKLKYLTSSEFFCFLCFCILHRAQRGSGALLLRTSKKERRVWAHLPATTMSTASVADVRLENKKDSRSRSDPGRPHAQCTPRPLPTVGSQRIIQGNGTNVGTVISLKCPAKHKLVGKDLKCIMGTNSTQWVGETFCQPLSPYENYGFRVAVLASIISSGIILLMSVAFITCCLLECTEEDKNKKEGSAREPNGPHLEGQNQRQEDSTSGYSHKGRNNNNNNAEKKALPWWETANPALCDNIQPCRYRYIFN